MKKPFSVSPCLRGARRRGRGFSLFEVIVAIFVFLIGVMGILMTFTAGMRARMIAQELIVSQDLAQMWAEWMRYRINEKPSAGAPNGTMTRASLAAGAKGDFYENSGSFYLPPQNSPNNPPTYHKSAYRGYGWSILKVNSNYKPQWQAENGTLGTWELSAGGGGSVPVGAPPGDLTEVELQIVRGAREYRFTFLFSGVGFKHDPL